MTSTITGVEHAPTALTRPVRDQIVLSAAEVANAYETALETPRLALTFLADCAALGRTPDARTRARYELAARIALKHGLAAVYEEPAQLSAADTAAAYEIGLNSPQYAEGFLAKRQAAGEPVVDAHLVAKFELAAKVARTWGHSLAAIAGDREFSATEKPEPVVSHTTTVTRRVPSPVVQRDDEGNRFVEAADARGGFRVSLVEREDGADVPPLILADVDSEYTDHDFAGLVAHLNELLAEIDPTGDLRAHAEKAVSR